MERDHHHLEQTPPSKLKKVLYCDTETMTGDNLPAKPQVTPAKSRISGTPTTFTHKSVDGFLKEDLDHHARRGVKLDDFLTEALGFDTSEWNGWITDWKLQDNEDFKQVAKKYPTKGLEVTRYKPFVEWSNHIMEAAKHKFPDQLGELKLKLHAFGRKLFPGEFGGRKPDVAGAETESRNLP
jgi:hypothetical protein